MPSTYTPSLRLELQADGENSGTWGQKVDQVISCLDDAVAGYTSITSTTSFSLTANNGSNDQARFAIIEFKGVLTSSINVTIPSVPKSYLFRNTTTGSFTIGITNASGAKIFAPQGFNIGAWTDGTNIYSSPDAVQAVSTIAFFTSSTRQFSIADFTAATDYLEARGGLGSGSPAQLTVRGGSATALNFFTKGGGPYGFYTSTDSAIQFQVLDFSGATTYIRARGGDGTSNNPQLSVQGSGVAGLDYITVSTGSHSFYTAANGLPSFRVGAITAAALTHIEVIAGDITTNPAIYATSTVNLQLGRGSAIPTSSTAGFVAFPTMTSAPIGIPALAGAGNVPFVVEVSGSGRAWFYVGGSWRSVALA